MGHSTVGMSGFYSAQVENNSACTGTRYIQLHTWPGISHVTGYSTPVFLSVFPTKKNRSHPVHRVLIYCDFTFGHCRNSGGESRAQAWLLSPRHEAREFVGQRRHREAGGLWLGARDPGVGGAQLGRFVAWELLGNYGYHELVKASFLAARMIG